MGEKRKRRWLRFSIRTLLLAVTVFCVWLGWQANVVRERNAMRRWISNRGGAIDPNDFSWIGQGMYQPTQLGEPSLARRLLGDKRVSFVYLPSDQVGEARRVREVFPDAEIVSGPSLWPR